jgi:hypothetical protein
MPQVPQTDETGHGHDGGETEQRDRGGGNAADDQGVSGTAAEHGRDAKGH